MEEYRDFVFTEAKSLLQTGRYPPTFTAVFGLRAEVYQIDMHLPLQERDSVYQSIVEMTRYRNPDRVSYVWEGFLYKIGETSASQRMLSMVIQDPKGFWQYIFGIVSLADGTSYPGPLLLIQDPGLPPVGAVPVQHLFYGPPLDTPKLGLN